MSRRKISKIVVIGDSAVGKSSLIMTVNGEQFVEKYKATVGADFYEKEVIVFGNKIFLEIWDTAGQERFNCLGTAFYRGADCCVLVYDITNVKSFNNIESWISTFIENGNLRKPQIFPFVLLGNKSDLQEAREVDSQAVEDFLAKHPKIKHFLVSAKNGEGVNQALQKIAQASVENRLQEIFPIIELIPERKPCRCCLNRNRPKKRLCCS